MEDNAKTNFQKNKKYYIFGAIFLVLFFGGFFAYKKGYRLTSSLTVGKIGYLEMEIPLINTPIFIDQSDKINTTKDNETVRIPFSPKIHSVIVAHEGYFPWKKDFLIESNKTTKIFPIFVTQNATGEIITKNDPEYQSIRNKVIFDKIPEKNSPLLSPDGKVPLWLDDNAIIVKVGEETKTVIQPDTLVRNVSFYKDRSDAVMFSTSGSVFVIEISEDGGQNFMPIYRGQKPSFVKNTANSIYILDGENLMEVVI